MTKTDDVPALIGLTGAIGVGKSVVAEVWKELGAIIVEGDEMGRRALEEDANLRMRLAKRFGANILNQSGRIIRSQLAAAAFADEAGRRDLTVLTFPTLYRLAKERFREISASGNVAVFDAALIYEWGVEADFDIMVVVTAQEERALRWVASRMNISIPEARKRLAGQISPQEKARRADFTLKNDGDVGDIRKLATRLWRLWFSL